MAVKNFLRCICFSELKKVCILGNSVVDPDPDPHGSSLIWSAGSRSRWAKMALQKEKKVKKCIVFKCWMFSFES
jgi:hypothetical protein